jgi:hypothetical protein
MGFFLLMPRCEAGAKPIKIAAISNRRHEAWPSFGRESPELQGDAGNIGLKNLKKSMLWITKRGKSREKRPTGVSRLN